MKNTGVTCDVCECCHNIDECKCDLSTIQVTHQKTSQNSMDTPHFCKNYEAK